MSFTATGWNGWCCSARRRAAMPARIPITTTRSDRGPLWRYRSPWSLPVFLSGLKCECSDFLVRDTLKKSENATVGRLKPVIFHDPESASRNSSDGVSRFRRSWLEVEMAVLHTDVGSGVWAGRPRTSQEEELP